MTDEFEIFRTSRAANTGEMRQGKHESDLEAACAK